MMRSLWFCALAACGGSFTGCTSGSGSATDASSSHGDAEHLGDGHLQPDAVVHSDAADTQNPAMRTVFVIPMENKDSTMIYGNTTNAPYINSLIASNGIAAHTTNFQDELSLSIPSEPHYIWMEAGSNAFSDHTFTTDDDASKTNSTSSTAHLATQLTAAGRTWTAYEEGITTGTCPVSSNGEYAAKHSPFVFFQDVSGSTPSTTAPGCTSHYKAIGSLATDLAAGTVPNYAFITPNLCHDMHGDLLCPSGISDTSNVSAGDTWLSANLPALIAYTHTHDATIFVVWDEGDTTQMIPFLAIGDHVHAGTTSAVSYTHSSQVKTVEEILGLSVLPSVASATDLSALFDAGYVAP